MVSADLDVPSSEAVCSAFEWLLNDRSSPSRHGTNVARWLGCWTTSMRTTGTHDNQTTWARIG